MLRYIPTLEIYPSLSVSKGGVDHRRPLSLQLELGYLARNLASLAPSTPGDYVPSSALSPGLTDDQLVDDSAAAMSFRRSVLASAFSFTDDHEFEIQQPHSADTNKRSPGELSLADILETDAEDQRLREMDSPARRFYLARKMDLQASDEVSDEDGDDEDDSIYEAEFEPAHIEAESIPIVLASPSGSTSPPPRLSLRRVPNARNPRSSFFDDDDDDDEEEGADVEYGEGVVGDDSYEDDDFDEDQFEMGEDEMFAAYQDSRPMRFPRPTLSDVAEERSPYSAHYPTGFPLSGGRTPGSASLMSSRPRGPRLRTP